MLVVCFRAENKILNFKSIGFCNLKFWEGFFPSFGNDARLVDGERGKAVFLKRESVLIRAGAVAFKVCSWHADT